MRSTRVAWRGLWKHLRWTALTRWPSPTCSFGAILVCVDPAQLDPSFIGRRFDESLLADLPEHVDPCGENGEFHTFVHAGPIFDHPIEIKLGEVAIRDGFAFQDLLPAYSTTYSRGPA